MRARSRAAALCASFAALELLSACAAKDSGEAQRAASESTTTPSTIASSPAPAGPRSKNWFDLKVGDCLTEIPAVDTGAVTTTVVDCATPHLAEVFLLDLAEVFLLAPLAVNTAIDQVAMEKCAKGFVDYTGQPFVGGPFAVTYLIDSNQDRTANNPNPSTAICFLRNPNGEPLTESERF
ncbi:septum formation family protein [Mycobacterium sp. ITM-2016-00318]|uniref:septum formation family protein n=1 Tax=Mycobacterium sp. ITM-2016-00318 TaxID=2099693 RepID=UPI001E2CF6A0|nr:septum formation family protein [Mycobacterium sp. ITM-2016-00318]WNG91138.1 septum formation family protein [Mycobacterium sp. ITM-2016-00318]